MRRSGHAIHEEMDAILKKISLIRERDQGDLLRFSIPMQLKSRFVSPRFDIDCRLLRAQGMSMNAIADALGVSTDPVRRSLGDGTGGFQPLDRGRPRHMAAERLRGDSGQDVEKKWGLP